MTWVLILMMHVGQWGKTDSNSITTATFSSQATCEAAGQAAVGLAKNTVKEIKYVCAKQ